MKDAGEDVSSYPDPEQSPMGLMDVAIDDTELAARADALVNTFQADAAREAGIFHHLITLPTYHTAALSTDVLAEVTSETWACWPMCATYSAGNSQGLSVC
ncbi:MAG: hypothetical protein CM15mP120_11390 [Pseudomonadota bacterium]|nr:MAG: hypothetical protein CM15mP120_11390 [Pseudomonadota bacterium]